MNGVTILQLAVFGLEVVEAGGALAQNVRHGGESHANVLLCLDEARPQVKAAGEVLGADVTFADFDYGTVDLSVESKKKLIRVIREVQPDIVITQDPEHCYHDLDPDRRQAMVLVLEAMALASRDYELYETPGLEPHPIPTIYYMMPEQPNCVVDVSEVWDQKQEAMDKLETQQEFTAALTMERFNEESLNPIAPELRELKQKGDLLSIGKKLHEAREKSYHMYHGLCSHGHFALAEPYRREGKFHLKTLTT